MWQTLKQVIDTGQAQRLELRHAFNSATAWFDVLYTRLDDGIISASLDITARNRWNRSCVGATTYSRPSLGPRSTAWRCCVACATKPASSWTLSGC